MHVRRVVWVLALAAAPVLAQDAGVEVRAAPAAAQLPPRQDTGVDWKRQVLRVTGAGAPDMRASNPAQARLGAERSARAEAERRLLELAQGLPLRAGRSVGEEMAREEVRSRVQEALRQLRVVRKRYYSDSGVEVDVEVPLVALAAALVPAPASAVLRPEGPSTQYTGLLVDARGLGARPVLAPRLVDGAGQVLYSAELLSGEARKRAGVAGWFESLEEARASVLAGEQPLVLKAAQVRGSDLLLGEAEAKQLSRARALLSEGRVAIITQ